ncbi:TPA: DUF917 domain-containing protein [Candidatus Dependentiae bacterium]|nr:MAG: hypothetical protein A2Y17_09745 [Clostridiales bacterium GWF2_38_85]HBL98957.1 DUF917 domain-containing protein [Candidatus Dependentiae bacterium]
MKMITENDVKALSLGASLLGSGGGGTPTFEPLLLTEIIKHQGPIRLLDTTELKDDDLVLPLAYMGAPLVSIEKLANGSECDTIMRQVERLYGKRPTVLLSAEIGGSNAFTAPLLAHRYNLPVLDADLIGRAFPQLEMSSAHLAGISPSPAFIGDSLGKSAVLEARSAQEIEQLARYVTMACGSNAAVGIYLMTGKEAKTAVVPASLTRAIQLGQLIGEARTKGLKIPDYLTSQADAQVMCVGTVKENSPQTIDGFTVGTVCIESNKGPLTVWYKNEFLLARTKTTTYASTPDIITIIDEETGAPLQTDSIQYGLRVAVITLPAPAIWKTAAGLKLVGPEALNLKGIA